MWINKGTVSRVLRDYFDIWEERGVEDDRKVLFCLFFLMGRFWPKKCEEWNCSLLGQGRQSKEQVCRKLEFQRQHVRCEMPVRHVRGNIGCTPQVWSSDTQAGDLNVGVIITWKIQKAINLDETTCAVGVKRVNYDFQCWLGAHSLRRAPAWWHDQEPPAYQRRPQTLRSKIPTPCPLSLNENT